MTTVVVLSLAGFIPGFMLVDWCTGTSQGLPWYEKGLYAVGAGYGLIVSGTLLLSAIPGPIERWYVLVLYGSVNLFLFAVWVLGRRAASQNDGRTWRPRIDQGQRGILAAIVVVVALTLFFRFTDLSYAEFQGDEAAVALTAVDVIEGYDNALFLRLKGPAEVLLPALVYRVTGSLTEFQARLPFAIANSTAVLAILLLGSRLISPLGGWIAAVLLALDGYLIAFGRLMQYQSLVFLMVVLTVLILYRLARNPACLEAQRTALEAGVPGHVRL